MKDTPERGQRLALDEMCLLGRFNTPTIYNGWEQITKRDSALSCFNLEETHDFMPQMGPMVGRAVTVVAEPGNPSHKKNQPNNLPQYREYLASVEGPKIVVVQDLDKPRVLGSFWGEVNSNIHLALGCVGTITDGAVRDLDEMTAAGFKAIARRLCVGHAHSWPVRWNCEVEVFGTKIQPGQLIHADKHGFLIVPQEDEENLLEAALFMDQNECRTLISAARSANGKNKAQILKEISHSATIFREEAKKKFSEKER